MLGHVAVAMALGTFRICRLRAVMCVLAPGVRLQLK